MDDVTNKALKFISENPALVQGIASMADSFRNSRKEEGKDVSMEDMAMFIFDSFVDITTVNGHSPFVDARMMNVVMAITDSSGYEL